MDEYGADMINGGVEVILNFNTTVINYLKVDEMHVKDNIWLVDIYDRATRRVTIDVIDTERN